METVRNTFNKKERLSSKTSIDLLFSGNAASMISFPLRIVYMTLEKEEGDAAVSILISVPKKRFKRAVKRNRIKRQIREAYRKNKHSLIKSMEDKNQRLLVAFIYVDNQLLPTETIEKSLQNVIERLCVKLTNEEK